MLSLRIESTDSTIESGYSNEFKDGTDQIHKQIVCCKKYLAMVNMVLWERSSLWLPAVGKYKAPGVSTATFELLKVVVGNGNSPLETRAS